MKFLNSTQHDSSSKQKMNGRFFQKILRQIWVGFCLNTEKRFFLENLF